MSLQVLALLTVLCWTLAAQTPTGTIVGMVTDPLRAAIAGAVIELTNEQTGQKRTSTTDSDGSFRISDLPVGVYTATVEAKGFKQYTQRGVAVSVNRNVTLDAPLAIGDLSEKVQVDAAPPQVDTVSGALSSVGGPREASELPLNGRKYCS